VKPARIKQIDGSSSSATSNTLSPEKPRPAGATGNKTSAPIRDSTESTGHNRSRFASMPCRDGVRLPMSLTKS
jgi:hypothetical protein